MGGRSAAAAALAAAAAVGEAPLKARREGRALPSHSFVGSVLAAASVFVGRYQVAAGVVAAVAAANAPSKHNLELAVRAFQNGF